MYTVGIKICRFAAHKINKTEIRFIRFADASILSALDVLVVMHIFSIRGIGRSSPPPPKTFSHTHTHPKYAIKDVYALQPGTIEDKSGHALQTHWPLCLRTCRTWARIFHWPRFPRICSRLPLPPYHPPHPAQIEFVVCAKHQKIVCARM